MDNQGMPRSKTEDMLSLLAIAESLSMLHAPKAGEADSTTGTETDIDTKKQYFFDFMGTSGINVIDFVKHNLSLLKSYGTNGTEEQYILRIDCLILLMEGFDISIEFVNSGGIDILPVLLGIPFENVVARTLDFITILSQKAILGQNSIGQKETIMQKMLIIVGSQREMIVREKAIDAILSVMQNSKYCFDHFYKCGGYWTMLSILHGNMLPCLKIKMCGLIFNVYEWFPEARAQMSHLRLMSAMLRLLTSLPLSVRKELVLDAIYIMASDVVPARDECLNPEHDLLHVLEAIIEYDETAPDSFYLKEEKGKAEVLLKMLKEHRSKISPMYSAED